MWNWRWPARGRQAGEMFQLVAHVVLRAGRTCTAEELRRGLRRTLPPHMVPASFIFLDKFPLTPHGKVDRDKLPAPGAAAETPAPAEAPATDTEVLLAGVWSEVFQRSPIGRNDHFLDLGGDSLTATVVAAQVHAALKVELDLRLFADHPVLADLAAAIDALRHADHVKELPGLVRVPHDVPLPLSFGQERTWKHSQIPGGSAGYTVACSHRICGPLNAGVLRESMNYLVRRHEILRTTFDEAAGQPVQLVHPPGAVTLSVLDFAGAPEAEDRATHFFREEARRPFNLKQLPLLRFTLARIREDEHWLQRVNHHIISDAWSWKVYFHELALVYEAKLRGEAPPLPEFEPLQYGDYAAWQRQALHPGGPAFQETVEWWSRRFSDPLRQRELPFRRFWRSRRASPADGLIWWGVDPAISRRLDQVGREAGATYYLVRLAAFVALLAAKAGSSDVFGHLCDRTPARRTTEHVWLFR